MKSPKTTNQHMANVTSMTTNGMTTVIGVGDLTLHTMQGFEEALSETAASGNEVIVDFRKASYIDTAVIAALITPIKRLQERGARLKVLLSEGGYPQHVLTIVGFGDLMDIVVE